MYKDPALLDVQRYSAAGCTKIQRRWKWTDTGLLEVNRYSAVRVEWLDIKTWVKSVQLEWIRDILGLKFWFPTSWVLMLSMVLGGCVGVKELGSILEFWRSLHRNLSLILSLEPFKKFLLAGGRWSSSIELFCLRLKLNYKWIFPQGCGEGGGVFNNL